VALSPDGRKIVSTSLDGTIRLWDGESGKELRRLRAGTIGASRPIDSATFSPDGRMLLAILAAPPRYGELYMQVLPGRRVQGWDLLTGRDVATFDTDDVVTGVAFARGGRSAVGAGSGAIYRWPLPAPPAAPAAPAAGPQLSLDQPLLPDEPDHQLFALDGDEIHYVGFLTGGEAFSTGNRNEVTRWDIAAGKPLGRYAPADTFQWPDVQHISGDGRYAVSLNRPANNEAFLWELKSGLLVKRIIPQGIVLGAALSPDGALLALGLSPRGRAADGWPNTVRLAFYHTSDAEPAGKIDIAGFSPQVMAFTPDGNAIAVGGPDPKRPVALFELETAKLLKTFAAERGEALPNRILFSRDGSRVMATFSGDFVVWDFKSGNVAWQKRVPSGITCADLSSDGARVLLGTQDTNVRLFDVAKKREIAVFDHPLYPQRSVAFSPDGKRAIAGSHERRFRVWWLPE
jgi:WD40 repeat protein